ncbi:MAG: ABC transporter ATP-binding protein [Pseudomonadota bacterium]
MNNILQLQNISKDYRQGRSAVEVLKNINLTVKAGELIGIVGASGSGKSTLLHIAGLLDRGFSGSVLINSIITNDAKPSACDALRLRHLGFIYQYHHLLSDFNARENVAMPKLIAGDDLEESLEMADQLLARLGLAKRSFNFPGELSGGEQQRVAIARSLVNNPQLILADEPTGNLDSEASENAIQIFMDLAKERKLSAIIVTHNHQIAAKMDKVYELRYGELIESTL